MRIAIELNEALLREAKQMAANSGKTLTAFIEEAVRESLERRATHPELPTSGGGGLLPGVDLDNSAALLDLMEGRDDPD